MSRKNTMMLAYLSKDGIKLRAKGNGILLLTSDRTLAILTWWGISITCLIFMAISIGLWWSHSLPLAVSISALSALMHSTTRLRTLLQFKEGFYEGNY